MGATELWEVALWNDKYNDTRSLRRGKGKFIYFFFGIYTT